MAKGIIAKDNVILKIKEAFGSDFIGEYNKKYYVWADDGGEKTQIAISLTKPTVLIEANKEEDLDFTDSLDTEDKTNYEITPEEEKRVQYLMKELGF